jgi:hypothetical protein
MTTAISAPDFVTASRHAQALAWPSQPKAASYPPDDPAIGRSRLPAMQRAFLPTGGIVSGDCFSGLLRHHLDQPISTLARWIVGRQVISFEEQGQIWLPMFQFEPASLRVRCAVRCVIEELRGVFDEWELAQWFAYPNSLLDGQLPANAVAGNEHGVLEAARIDRFIAAG